MHAVTVEAITYTLHSMQFSSMNELTVCDTH